MDALQASLASSVPPASSRPLHRPDVSSPQPGVTAGESRMFQALGESCQRSGVNDSLGQGARTPREEYAGPSAASQPQAAPSSACSASLCLRLLHVLRYRLSLPRWVGSPQGLPLLTLVVLVHHLNRRLAMWSPILPLGIGLLFAWPT